MKSTDDLQVLATVANVDSISNTIWPEIINISDWVAIGVIVFVGGMWMFGNRSQAIQRLLDGSIGYLVIRHAPDILHWLKRF